MFKEKIMTRSECCPICGDNRYKVTKPDATSMDAYGKETKVKGGGPLIATCANCGCPVYVPWVEEKNLDERRKRRNDFERELIQAGYKKVKADDVMEKYGVETLIDLEDIISFSGFALDYCEDYDEGSDELIQDMYNVPAIFYNCVNVAYNDMEVKEEKERWDKYLNNAVELSRQECDNLVYIYKAKVIVFVGTKEEPPQIIINGTPIEEEVQADNPYEVYFAIQRALDKYDKSVSGGA